MVDELIADRRAEAAAESRESATPGTVVTETALASVLDASALMARRSASAFLQPW
ncbi:MAG: hypothetical protein ACM3JL_01460 [Nitrososphaerota archaeon]